MLRVEECHNQGVYLIDKFDEYFRAILKYSKGTLLDKREVFKHSSSDLLKKTNENVGSVWLFIALHRL